MRRILLACSSGMSTSLLMSKMKEEAKQQGLEVEIRAVGQEKAKDEMQNADVVLIGPQMRFLLDDLRREAERWGIPVDVIDMQAYGMADGKAVLEQALRLMGNAS